MSNIDEARAQLEEGLFDTDSSIDDDSVNSSSSDEEIDDDTSSLVHLKPALKIGDRVVAAWWDVERGEKKNTSDGQWFCGKVTAVAEMDSFCDSRASDYGPIRAYNIHYDDGDKLDGILDVFVCPEKDHELETTINSKDWRGVRNVKDRSSSDRYSKEIGWFVAMIGGEEKSFATLYEAMKKSDEYTNKVKKGSVRESDLNLPKEWEVPKKKKRGRPKKVDTEDDNPVKKKKKKPNMKDIFDDTVSESDDTMEDASESIAPDQVETLPGRGEPTYSGVCTIPDKIGIYRSLFYDKEKQRSAGHYMLRADAAHARDECCRELMIVSRNGPNFNTVEEYKIARTREIAARGLSLNDVGTLSETTAKIQDKKNEFTEEKQNRKEVPGDESEIDSDDESDRDQDEESVVGSKSSSNREQKKYTGVNYIPKIDRHRGRVWLSNKTYSAGDFILGADAAYARDEFCRAKNITNKGFNFNTEKEYKRARAMEIERRGLSSDETGTSADVLGRIQTKRIKWCGNKQRRVETDDSSQSSSDDLPLVAMKTKGRRFISPKETVAKTSSDYRGVTYNQREGKHWKVSIFYNDKDHFVGVYDLETDAARVYDEVAAILSCNDYPNFASKSDHEQARKREADTQGLSLELIDTFQASLEKAQIYVHSLLCGTVNDDGRVSRKTRSSSPFTPILSDCDTRSDASPVDNVDDSSKKISDLNEAMSLKWGRRLPRSGNLFINTYQRNICEMLGGFVDESSQTPIGTFVSISSLQQADGEEEQEKEKDLDDGKSAGEYPQGTDTKKSSVDSGDKLIDNEVENGTNEGVAEKEKPFERNETAQDNQDEVTTEKTKPVELHEHATSLVNQDEGIQEKKSDERSENRNRTGRDNQCEGKDSAKKKDVKYSGVVTLKKTNRYRGSMWYKGKRFSMGDFVLRADAAHARDEFCRSFNVNKPFNFNTQKKYELARAAEIAERGLTLVAADTAAKMKDVMTLSEVAGRIQVKKAKWDAESKKADLDAQVLPNKTNQSKQMAQDDDSDDNISLFSDTNDKQDNFAPSQDSAAVTVAVSNVTAATTKPKLSEMNLVSLEEDQEESLEYPIGCPVLWKLQDDSFQRGEVASAWLNTNQPIGIVYEVEPLQKESKQMKCASELTFDTHCPVYLKSSLTDNNTLVEGEVLLSRTDDAKTLYTILLKKETNEFQLKHDVPSDLLTFRKAAKESTSTSQRVTEASELNQPVQLHTVQKPQTKTHSAKEVKPKLLASPEKEVNSHCDMSISTSNSTISTRDSGRMSTPRGLGGNTSNGGVWDGRSIDIELPDWLVSDNRVKDHLACKYFW